MFNILRKLDNYFLLTAFSALALQYQFLRLTGFFIWDNQDVSRYEYYFLVSILMFFSMVMIYNIDHLWDWKLSFRHSHALTYMIAISLSALGILFWLIIGWNEWELSFLFWGMGVAILCGIHFIVFHSFLNRKLFWIKEISVTMITVIGISIPVFYVDYLKYSSGYFKEGILLNLVELGILFLVVFNSVLFYSWCRFHKDCAYGSPSIFHHLTFFQAQRLLLALTFFTLITEMLLLNNNFVEVNQVERGAIWFFPAVTLAQGYLVRKMNDSPKSMSYYRLLSEMIFLLLFPFFLW